MLWCRTNEKVGGGVLKSLLLIEGIYIRIKKNIFLEENKGFFGKKIHPG